MPQDPIAPSAPQEGNSNPALDPKSFLLPKKDAAAAETAQRVNAGALLAQEEAAATQPLQPSVPAAPKPAPITVAPKAPEGIQQLETYQGDIEHLVAQKNVSVVSIAAAEAARRGTSQEPSQVSAPIDWGMLAKRAGMVVAGMVLIMVAGAAVWYVLRPAPAVQIAVSDSSPFITVDDTKVLTVPAGQIDHSVFMQALAQQRDQVSLGLGLIERFELATMATSSDGKQGYTLLSAADLLARLSPDVPASLLRSIDPTQYLLGVHAYDGNQALLIFRATSYEEAYAGMLAWEKDMPADLQALFMRTPPVHINTNTNDATSTASSTPAAAPSVTNTGFVDQIVDNHDVRAIVDDAGDILMLWSAIDRQTFVITTNEATLREVISRLENSSIVPTP
ncbi:MAG TPA: hypothetical protein VG753_03210 [Candidatus Paceibacterota bacterium]|nr:hypothetical protein [Candidatus Paceibacterota bacterium]